MSGRRHNGPSELQDLSNNKDKKTEITEAARARVLPNACGQKWAGGP